MLAPGEVFTARTPARLALLARAAQDDRPGAADAPTEPCRSPRSCSVARPGPDLAAFTQSMVLPLPTAPTGPVRWPRARPDRAPPRAADAAAASGRRRLAAGVPYDPARCPPSRSTRATRPTRCRWPAGWPRRRGSTRTRARCCAPP
ncbi:hypothetical protein GXW82_04470 [Streptacidiphilus sp. 4-A2]|nr:hypothetical protein [Streptacidiphilus sp. 4-A2]